MAASLASAAQQLKNQAGSVIGSAVDQAKTQAASVASTAKQGIYGAAEEQKNAAADKVGRVAEIVHGAAEALERELPHTAHYVREAGSSIDQAAAAIRQQSVATVLQLVSDFARRQPVLAMGISAMAGLALARFMKSSSGRTSRVGFYAGSVAVGGMQGGVADRGRASSGPMSSGTRTGSGHATGSSATGSTAHRTTSSGPGLIERLQSDPVLASMMTAVVGLVVGALFPPTETENRLMGEASDSVKERAGELAQEQLEKAKAVAQKALDEAKNEAQAQGLPLGTSTGGEGTRGQPGPA